MYRNRTQTRTSPDLDVSWSFPPGADDSTLQARFLGDSALSRLTGILGTLNSWMRDLKIRTRLNIVVVSVSALTLLVTMVFLYAYSLTWLERQWLRLASDDVSHIARHAVQAVVDRDPEAAAASLSEIQHRPGVILAWIADIDDVILARSPADAEIPSPLIIHSESQFIDHAAAHTYRPVMQGDRQVGTVYLENSIEQVSRLRRDVLILTIVLLMTSMLFSFALSNSLQRLVSSPFQNYAAVVRRITRSRDYSLRVDKEGENELGQMVDDFNAMVAEIELRDVELQKSEREYRELVQNARALILRMTVDGDVIFMNEYAREFFGYGDQDIVGRSVVGLILPEVDDDGTDMLEWVKGTVAAIDENREFEKQNICRDGRRVWISWHNKAVRNGNDKVTEILAVGLDMTQQQHDAEKLQASEVRYRALVEQSMTGIYILSKENFHYVNQGLCRMMGYTQEEFLTMPPTDAVQPWERERMAENVRLRLSGEVESIHYIAQGNHKDGRLLWLEIHGTHIELGGEQLIAGMVLDVTERQVAADVVRQSEERLQRALENSPDVFVIYDNDLRIQYINEATRKITGMSTEEFIGKRDSEIWPPEIYQGYMPTLMAARDTGRTQFVETKLEFAGSPTRTVQITCVPLLDEEGAVREILGVTHDITERVKAEAEIMGLNEGLEHRVEERTAQLAAANQELEAFAYSVSHDLRAPLRHVTGFVDLLHNHRADGMDETEQNYLGIIRQSAKRMGRLIDDLLEFSKAGRTELHKELTSLSDLVTDVREEIQAGLADRRVEWRIGKLTPVYGDRTGLKQVMTNLMENAVKYTRVRDTAVIEIGSRQSENDETVVFIRDNGVGFDMKYVDKLFGVFQRLHRAEDFEGSGVGLANVRRIIRRHGGRVWAEGRVGEGATFFFALPGTGQKKLFGDQTESTAE
jgi:PAS domain S-box-containing protein